VYSALPPASSVGRAARQAGQMMPRAATQSGEGRGTRPPEGRGHEHAVPVVAGGRCVGRAGRRAEHPGTCPAGPSARARRRGGHILPPGDGRRARQHHGQTGPQRGGPAAPPGGSPPGPAPRRGGSPRRRRRGGPARAAAGAGSGGPGTGAGARPGRGAPAPPADLTTLGGKPGIYELVFADSRDGLAYGPRLYATHDGGSAWQRVRLPGDVEWLAAGGGTAYAIVMGTDRRLRGYPSPVTQTHWSGVAGLPAKFGDFAGQYPITLYGKAAWIFLGGDLYATKTGASWQRDRIPCPAGFPAMRLAAQDESRVSVACEQPAIGTAEKIIFNSRDGGHTFSRARQVPPLIGDGSNLARPSPGHFALACVSSRVTANLIYSSSDGGRTWRTALELIDGAKGWLDLGFATAL